MNHCRIILLLLIAAHNVGAQIEFTPGRRQNYLRVMPIYQRWAENDSTAFAQFSIPVYVRLALGRSLQVALRGSQATANGDGLQKLSGVTDTQLSCNYGVANFIFTLGFNLPSGKRALTYNEFLTTSLLSLNHYNFQTPGYGQGFNVLSGFTWAWPISEKLAVGVGASYQYKGKFQPLTFVDEYDPGDEILLTGGLDWRVGETAQFSLDLISTLYGKDKIDTAAVFAAGNRLVAHAQFRQNFSHAELWLFARYLSRGKNSLAAGGALLPEDKKSAPDQIEMSGQYFHRFTRRVAAGFLVEGHYFTTPPAVIPLSSAGISIFGLGATLEFSLSPRFKIPARVKYLIGRSRHGKKFSGLEAGVGVSF
jgi:hypothetical protein